MIKSIFSTFLVIFLLSGCVSPLKITDRTIKISSEQGLEPEIYKTENFSIFTLKKITNHDEILRVYIEGDGKAFVNKYTASSNPTPTSYFLVNLIKEDAAANILYLARPCQYQSTNQGFCATNKYWTKNRLAPEVIVAMNEVLAEFANFKIEIIGYSGGGEIAKYLALRNRNIINLRTIAGNVDQEEFAKTHKVPALDDNFNEGDLVKLSKLPQIHFIGEKDKIVPINVIQKYLQKLPQQNCFKIIEVKNATHTKGWNGKWREFLKESPRCFIPN